MQSLILFAIIILITGLLFLILKWPQGKHVTFSGHAAAYKHTIIYYNILFTVVLPLFILFFLGWFVPVFKLPILFSLCIVISCIFQYIATLIPETGGWKTKYHRLVTLVSVLFLLPPMIMIIISNEINLLGRIVTESSLIIMLCILGMIAINKGKQRYSLFVQIVYYAAFFGAILVSTYV